MRVGGGECESFVVRETTTPSVLRSPRRVAGGVGYRYKSTTTTTTSRPSVVVTRAMNLPDQGLPKGVKPPRPPPTFVRPPTPPPSVETWQNMVLLMDKPKGWTSFDVVGKEGEQRRDEMKKNDCTHPV